MLDQGTEWWFGALQSLGALATTGALIFVGFQTYFTTKQVKAAEDEANIRLTPWIYRILNEDNVFEFTPEIVKVYIKNPGKLPAHRIYFYYMFEKNEPNDAATKQDIENQLLNEEPIIYERLLASEEEM